MFLLLFVIKFSSKSLTETAIPNNITFIDDYALESCKSLTEIIIPNDFTSIE